MPDTIDPAGSGREDGRGAKRAKAGRVRHWATSPYASDGARRTALVRDRNGVHSAEGDDALLRARAFDLLETLELIASDDVFWAGLLDGLSAASAEQLAMLQRATVKDVAAVLVAGGYRSPPPPPAEVVAESVRTALAPFVSGPGEAASAVQPGDQVDRARTELRMSLYRLRRQLRSPRADDPAGGLLELVGELLTKAAVVLPVVAAVAAAAAAAATGEALRASGVGPVPAQSLGALVEATVVGATAYAAASLGGPRVAHATRAPAWLRTLADRLVERQQELRQVLARLRRPSGGEPDPALWEEAARLARRIKVLCEDAGLGDPVALAAAVQAVENAAVIGSLGDLHHAQETLARAVPRLRPVAPEVPTSPFWGMP